MKNMKQTKVISKKIGKCHTSRFMEKDIHGCIRKYPLCDMLQRRGSIIEAINKETNKAEKLNLYRAMYYWDSEIIRVLSKTE